MADQLGLRRVLGNTFKVLWQRPSHVDPLTFGAYFKVLQRADADLDRDPASCLPLWRYSIPAEFKDYEWDFVSFDVGERFFYEPLPRAEFDQILQDVERWGLDDHMELKVYEDLAAPVSI
jgi:hypothetical protein